MEDMDPLVISDEERDTGSATIAASSPHNSVNSMLTSSTLSSPRNGAAPIDMTIGDEHRVPEAGGIETNTSRTAYARGESVISLGTSSNCNGMELKARQSGIRINIDQEDQQREQRLETVGATSSGVQTDEAIYLNDSPSNTPESMDVEQHISNVVPATKQEDKEKRSVPMRRKRNNNIISLVAYTENSIVPQPPTNEFSSNCITESHLQVTAVNTCSVVGVSTPIESPPSTMHVHPTAMSQVASQKPGSAIHSLISGASTQTVGSSNSESTQLVAASQVPLKTVNANVLDQVVKLAASKCEQLMPENGSAEKYEIYLYRLLTNLEEVLQREHQVSMPGASSNTHIYIQNSSHRSSCSGVTVAMDDDVVCVSPLNVSQKARQEEELSKPIVLSEEPEKNDIHNGVTHAQTNKQTSTITASKKKQKILLTTETSSSMCNESSFNSTLIEEALEDSFDDECPTPVPKQSQTRDLLKRALSNESSRSEHSEAPPRKRSKNRSRRSRSAGVHLEEVVPNAAMAAGTLVGPSDVMISSSLPLCSENLGHPVTQINPCVFTEELSNKSIPYSTPTPSCTEEDMSSDSSVGRQEPAVVEKPKPKRKKRRRCRKCANCLIPDCNKCRYCLDQQRYPQPCINRRNNPCLTWSDGGQSSSNEAPVNHPPSLRNLRLLPAESADESDDEFHERLDKALRDGYVEIFTAKCGVSGPPGTGKSHFRALISGKDRPACRQSTALATEAEQVTPVTCITPDFEEEIVEFHRNKSGSKVKWLVVGSKKLSLLIAKTIHNQTKRSKSASGGEASSDPGPLTHSQQKHRMSAIRKEIKKHLKMLSKCKGKPKCLHKMKLLYIVDTGGQPQFQEVMPIFVRNSSMTLLVHKLNESLDDCPRFDYEINGVRYSVPDEMLVTNREYLEQSLRTICSCFFSRKIGRRASRAIPKPHFAVIGMFKDQCSDVMLQEKHKAVNECIERFTQSKKCTALTPSRHIQNPVFAVDGSADGWASNGDVIDDLHAHIERVTKSLGVKIPIRWFLFLNLLKDHSRRSPFLSLNECYKIAEREDIMMDENDVNEALVLFDELNLILYFPNILRDVVFCSPEFLFNKVSEIIAQSFDCHDDSSGLSRQERLEFHKTGIFTRDLLERVRSLNRGFDEATFKIDDLLYLLVKLCIIAEVSPSRFFIPCVLALQRKDHNSRLLIEIRSHMHELGIEALVISFPDGYSPRGLFCASVAHLAKMSNWIVESTQCRLERKRNLIEFELREHTRGDGEVQRAAPLGRVVIMDMISHIEVYSTCETEHLCDIRRAIYGALWYAAECLSYSPTDMEVNVGFACHIDCGVSEPHGTAAIFSQKTQKWLSKCIRNSSKHGRQLTPQQAVWFTSENNLSGPAATLPDLLNEVATATNKWEQIALQLDLSHTDIERIKTDQQSQTEACFIKVFNKWETKLTPPFTWPVIIRALESPSVAEFRLASQLKARHLIVSA